MAGSGNITLKKSSDNSTVQAMPVGGGNVTISGNTVTINPTANLDFGWILSPDCGYRIG